MGSEQFYCRMQNFMLTDIIKNFFRCRILVVGDLIADEFVYGEIARISREAPVMILRYERTETMPGGAANAAANVAALAGQTTILGIVGDDIAGTELKLSLQRLGVATTALITQAGYITPTKTRILAGSVHSTRQQVIRIDKEPQNSDYAGEFNKDLITILSTLLAEVDGVIISDYNYGMVNELLLNSLRRAMAERYIPIVIDSRFQLRTCNGFTAATPNQAELEALINNRLVDDITLFKAASELRSELDLQALLLTRGNQGMVLFTEMDKPYSLTAVGSKEPVDVTGAGDTVIATFTLALAAGASFAQAAEIANHAGGLVVMKRGTATINTTELIHSIISNE
jgi:rfaE bifunctional protein kinase chain/domain